MENSSALLLKQKRVQLLPLRGSFFVSTGHIQSNLPEADLHQNFPFSVFHFQLNKFHPNSLPQNIQFSSSLIKRHGDTGLVHLFKIDILILHKGRNVENINDGQLHNTRGHGFGMILLIIGRAQQVKV